MRTENIENVYYFTTILLHFLNIFKNMYSRSKKEERITPTNFSTNYGREMKLVINQHELFSTSI